MPETLGFVLWSVGISVVPWLSWVDGDAAPSKASRDSCDNNLI